MQTIDNVLLRKKQKRDYLKSSLYLLLIFFSLYSMAQDSNFGTISNKLVAKKDTSYSYIDSLMRPFRRDSSLLKQFIALSSRHNYYEGQAYALDMLGVIYRNKSSYKKAIVFHKEAFILAQKLPNIDFKVTSLNMLGVVYRRMDEVRTALDYHQQALMIAESSGKQTEQNLRNIAVSYNSIGNLYLTLRQYDLAEEQFKKALAIEKKVNNKLGLAINYQNLGGIYEEKGELSLAMESYNESLNFNKQIHSELGEMICYNSIGQILLKQNKPRAALNIVLPTVTTAEKMEDNFYIAWSNVNVGWAYTEFGEYDVAIPYLNKALTAAIAANQQSYMAEAYKRLSEVYEKKGLFKEALAYKKKQNEQDDKILNEKNQQYVADLILKYDSDKKKNQIQLLEKENEIVKIKLSENRNLFIFFGIAAILSLIIYYILSRQRELRNKTELLSLEQKMMRSQMNPHFIFNSLNSIKLYIINNEKDKAVYYLNKFSKLMRIILANSQEKEITLEEELATMDLYLNIENLRFTNKIKYNVTIENDVNTKNVKIPSLILQPFLENAIWHGLSMIEEGEKRIDLTISSSFPKSITVTITDNGIGRERSKEIKEKKTIKHKSIGLSLTQERLDSFSKTMDASYSLVFEDLYDSEHKPTGTKVVLTLPAK